MFDNITAGFCHVIKIGAVFVFYLVIIANIYKWMICTILFLTPGAVSNVRNAMLTINDSNAC